MISKNVARKMCREYLKTRTHHNDDTLNMLVSKLEEFEKAKTVALFCSKPEEIQTTYLFNECLKANKTIALPVIVDDKNMIFYRYDKDIPLVMNEKFNVLEPDPTKREEINGRNIDFMVLPALGYTKQRDRIGYGKGFYDRYLAKIPQAISIGITLTALLDDEIPLEAWDLPVHYLATEKEIIKLR